MTVCAQCGERNTAGVEFCGRCGEFLEWEGAREEPEPVQPGEMAGGQGRHRAQRTVLRKPLPGELICGECGAGNTPVRKFCGRCGTSLAEAVVTPRPWWRRWIPKRGPKELKAGSRPRGTGGFAVVRRQVARGWRGG